jgi:hypothetical protein
VFEEREVASMKAFLLALVFFALAVVATGFVLDEMATVTATEAYSTESARPEGGEVENRGLGWGEQS